MVKATAIRLYFTPVAAFDARSSMVFTASGSPRRIRRVAPYAPYRSTSAAICSV